jgi:NAD-dependent dihydropyrimidine dehydrogenase PreA subunit
LTAPPGEPVRFPVMLGENEDSMPSRQRKRFPWFPTIKGEGCLLDLECLNFCPAGVFDWDPATGKPVVARPFDCIPGCRSCAENCKGKSISLPGKREMAAALERIRAEDGRTRVAEGVRRTTLDATPGRRQRTSQTSRAQGNNRKSGSSLSVITFTTRLDRGQE